MFSAWRRAVEETAELDLIPVMNLFMVLIPFLLMGAAFYHVAVIPSSLPTHTPNESDVPRTPTKVTVNLAVAPGELELSASSTSLDEAALADMAATFPKRGDAYDIGAVRDHLQAIKSRYPASDTMIVLPYEDLDYQTLVALLDGTREVPAGKSDMTPAQTLFPVVVFSRLLQPQPEQDTAGTPEELSP